MSSQKSCLGLILMVVMIGTFINECAASNGLQAGSNYRIDQPQQLLQQQQQHYVEESAIKPIVFSSQQRRPSASRRRTTTATGTFNGSLGRVLLKRQEAVLKDPRFVNCMSEADGPEDPSFMAVFARCYSYAGRPRFGKRGSQQHLAMDDNAY